MSNPFLTEGHEEIETALLLENAMQIDLSILAPKYASAVAFTDGRKTYVNSDDNLAKILPNYSHKMLKWLLWHEKYHIELKHHKRYFKYLEELRTTHAHNNISQEEVNIIMDILVHDSLSTMFPELVDIAVSNLAQMRERNSLKYTFKTRTLEEMLEEYQDYKNSTDDDKSKSDDKEDTPDTKEAPTHKSKSAKSDDKAPDTEDKSHKKGGHSSKEDTSSSKETAKEPAVSEHDKTDWSKLDNIDSTEFIEEEDSYRIEKKVEELKRKKVKLATITQTLNGLATTSRQRTYAIPSYITSDRDTILKGRKPGKTALYLVFDASGSMGAELSLFKNLIEKSIPQAMSAPTEWFSGYGQLIKPNAQSVNKRNYGDYYKGTFKDLIPVRADNGYNDDGDRTIELCLEAERHGYSPIGVTDGGGGLYAPEMVKKLNRTILVGDNQAWLDKVKAINPRVQTICI